MINKEHFIQFGKKMRCEDADNDDDDDYCKWIAKKS